MKRILFAFCIAITGLVTSANAAAANVDVSISIGDPRFYGRVDIGDFPQPRLIYRTPVVVVRERVNVERPPIYLRVPPGHAKHWEKHCRQYNACGQRVYFVDDRWYNDVYVPRYRERHFDNRSRADRDDRDQRHDDRQDKHYDKERGKGHGKQKKGKGHDD